MFIGKTGHINVGRIYWSTPTPATTYWAGVKLTIIYIGGAPHKNVGRGFRLESELHLSSSSQ